MSAAPATLAPSSTTTRVRGLDGLRAIAAFAIFFHHVGFWTGTTFDGYHGNYLGRLDIGVPVFFSLSGFLLFRPIAAAVLDDRPLRPALVHVWRRALRIYPAFWVALIVIVALTSEEFRNVGGVITTSLLIHIHWPDYSIGPIPQSWSLATEVTFYASLPLMARVLRPWLCDRDRAGRRNGLFGFVAACYLLSVGFRVWMLGLDNGFTSSSMLWLPGTLDYFAIGMALAVAREGFATGSSPRARLERWAGPAGVWWLVAALLFHVVSQRMGLALGVDMASWDREMGRQFVYGAIGFCLLFPLLFGDHRPSAVRRLVRSAPMEWLGTISYSIYLWHMVFIVHPWEPMADLMGGVTQFDTPFWRHVVVAGVPMLVVSALSYYAVERVALGFQGRVRRPVLDPTPAEKLIARGIAGWRAASFRAQLGIVAGIGLVGRVLYVVLAKLDQTLESTDVFPGDQFYYSLAGDALARGDGFVTPWQHIAVRLGLADAADPAAHAADHPPLTALVAAPASFLPGERGDHLFEQRIVMCLVGAGVILLVGLLARELAGPRVGVMAGVVAAVYPGFWINDGLVMAESLTVLMTAGALWTAVRYRRRPSGRLAIELGVWVGLAALARAESLLLLALVVAPLMWATHRDRRRAITRIGAVAAVTVALLAPWIVPNLVRFDEPVLMSTNDGLTLIGANSPQTYDGEAVGFWSLEYAGQLEPGLPELVDADASVSSRVWRNEAFDFIADNLADQPRVMAARVGRLWSVYRPLQMVDWNTGEGRERWASQLAVVGFWVSVPLALLGWWRLGREGQPRWLFAALALQVTIVGALFYGIPRFRVPAEIGVVVCTAIALRWLASLGSCRQKLTSSSPPSSS